MKHYLSVMMLFARSTFYKLLGLLALAGIAETVLFYDASGASYSLENAFQLSHIPHVAGAVFLAWFLVLFASPLRQAGFTLCRLSINRRQLYLCHTLYNLLACVIFWAFQVCLLPGLFAWYGTQHTDPAIFSSQSILLAFYRNDFLHSLLPLADWTRYLRNLFLALIIGSSAAYPMTRWRTPGRSIVIWIVTLVCVWNFPAPTGSRSSDIVWIIMYLIIFAIQFYCVDEKADLSASGASPAVPASPLFEEGGNGGAL